MKRIFLASALALAFCFTAPAQSAPPPTGTAHGVQLTWSAAPQGSDTNAYTGYFVLRCTGTCTDTSTWTQLNTTPEPSLTYLDPAADNFTAGTTYSYVVVTVDSAGHTSAYSSIATAAIPAAGFPVSPNAPTNAAAKVF